MTLVRWEPFREIDSLQREMNRLFNTLSPSSLMDGEFEKLSFVPAAEMSETPEAVDIKLEVPASKQRI